MSRLHVTSELRELTVPVALTMFMTLTLLFPLCRSEARTRPHYGGEIRLETSDAEAPDFVKLLITDTLTYIDARGVLRPGLAVRWESQNGDRRWQLWLRPGVRLHGTEMDEPLTAALAADAIRKGLAKSGMDARVQFADDRVNVEFGAPVPQFAALLAGAQFGVGTLYPKGVVAGSGPYAIQSIVGPRITLAVNPDYWGGRRYPATITVLCGRTVREQALDLAAKRADLMEVPPEELRRAQQERTRLSQIAPTELIVMTAERARATDSATNPATNPKLRQALSESVDRPALLNFIFQKQGEATGGLLPNWLTGYGALLTSVHDAAHARQLRAEAGGRAAFTLGYEVKDAELQLVAERIALNAREAGLTVQAVARTSDVDWLLRRIEIKTANPPAALTNILHALGGTLELNDLSLEAVYRAERAALADYMAIPLLHLNRAWAASERLHDWSSASPLMPLPSETWVSGNSVSTNGMEGRP
jgi:peptide/nickel transport system substrate-binding protein